MMSPKLALLCCLTCAVLVLTFGAEGCVVWTAVDRALIEQEGSGGDNGHILTGGGSTPDGGAGGGGFGGLGGGGFGGGSGAFGGGGGGGGAPALVWINEIHYANTGGDQDEGVEVAGVAGTDLAGWSLVFYGGSGTIDATLTLSGTIPDQQASFGTLWFAQPDMGDGTDGVALVDDMSQVVQLLSYEGTVTASEGPADGMLSTDIGVSEPPQTATGESLQLSGTGSQYTDFTWVAPAAQTLADINNGQTLQ